MGDFTKKLPEWNAIGAEPDQDKRNEGWGRSERPPADWFNWFFNTTYQALKELQEKAAAAASIFGLGNTDVLKIKAATIEVDTRTLDIARDGNNRINTAKLMDGITVVKTTAVNRDVNGKITEYTVTAGATTTTYTINRDANGRISKVPKGVV